MKQRLRYFYQKRVIPRVRTRFDYQNIYKVPRIEKIVVNRGLGNTAQNVKLLDSLLSEMTKIVTQRGVVTRARRAIAGFKIREKMPIGLIVTLRGDRIYAFLDRLVNLALPRIRDFQGVNPQSFDGRGNYSLGFKEQLMFPEVRYDQMDDMCGINLSIVTTSCSDEERSVLLERLGIPFQNSSSSKD